MVKTDNSQIAAFWIVQSAALPQIHADVASQATLIN